MVRINKIAFTRPFITFLIVTVSKTSPTLAAFATAEAPLIRGPGVLPSELEAYAEAQSRATLAEQLDNERPGTAQSEQLKAILERAQSAWLGGSLENARTQFQSLARLTDEADWREPQREALHYSHLRLAQLAKSGSERQQWLQSAVSAFPDLQADPNLFPPPLLEEFRKIRSQLLSSAKIIGFGGRFSDFRFVLINGRKFELSPDLKVRLPSGTFRVTLLSDLTAPVTAKLSQGQLESYQTSMPALAGGDCQAPAGADLVAPVKSVAVLYAGECVRTRDKNGWLPKEVDAIQDSLFDLSPSITPSSQSPWPLEPTQPQATSSLRRPWMWAGIAALVTGAAWIAYRELNREKNQNSRPEPEKPGPTQIRPVQREGL